MNDQEPKPGVVIDVDPEHDMSTADEQPGQAAAPRKSSSAGVFFAILLALIALGACAALGYFGYQYWKNLVGELNGMQAWISQANNAQAQLQSAIDGATSALREQSDALASQRDALAAQQASVNDAKSAFQNQEKLLKDENLRMQEREAELRAAVADVHRRVGRSGTQWMIAEAEYLIRLANDRLILARDTESARVALELADQRLRDTKDPGWAGAREQLARDIAQLSAFEAPDIAGMSARLAALIDQVPDLTLADADAGPERTLPDGSEDGQGKQRSWETLVDDVWQGFKNSIRIRERDAPVQAMLSPENEFFMYENLRLQLEAARYGLASGDQAVFSDNLEQAENWLGQFFDPNNGAAVAIREAIDELKGVDIQPPMPDISQSLRTLQVREKLMQEVAPTGLEGDPTQDASETPSNEASKP